METPAYELLPLEILDLLLSLIPWQLPFLWRTSKWWQMAVEWFGERTGREIKKIHPRGVVGFLKLLVWSQLNLPFNARLLDHAARWGSLEVVKELLSNKSWKMFETTYHAAAKGDNLGVLQYLLKEFPGQASLGSLAIGAVKKNSSRTLAWLVSREEYFHYPVLFGLASGRGHVDSLEVLQEVYGEKQHGEHTSYAENAVRGNSLPALLWLKNKGYRFPGRLLLSIAALKGFEEIFLSLLEEVEPNRATLLRAAEGKSDRILKEVLLRVTPDRKFLQTMVEERNLFALRCTLEVFPLVLELVLWLSVDLNKESVLELCLSLGGVVTEELLFLAASLSRWEMVRLFLAQGVSPVRLEPLKLVRPKLRELLSE